MFSPSRRAALPIDLIQNDSIYGKADFTIMLQADLYRPCKPNPLNHLLLALCTHHLKSTLQAFWPHACKFTLPIGKRWYKLVT